eukprot:11887_1
MSCIFHCGQNALSNKLSNSSSIHSPEQMELTNAKSASDEELNHTLRVLLLGISNSGKTTILKQVKRMNNNLIYDCEHLNDRRKVIPHIHTAVIEYMQTLCQQSEILSKEHKENTSINPKYDTFTKEILALKPPFTLNPDIGFKIRTLWRDKGIRNTLNKRSYFQIDDNVDHFLNKIGEIADPAYLPDSDDYLRLHQKSVGITRNCIDVYGDSFACDFEFIDVKGQRWERKKWNGFIKESDAVLYVISLYDYDLKSFEDDETNCLLEAIDAFRDTMVQANFLEDKSLVILFNKFEEFQEKIQKIPITVAFDDFPVDEMNPNNPGDVIRFVAGKLYNVFEEHQIQTKAPLQMIRTNATDKDHIEKIMTDVTIALVKKKLEKTN